jgi:hypothetical protein
MGMMQMLMGGSRSGGVVNPLAGGTAVPVGLTEGGQVAVLADGRLGVTDSFDYVYQNWFMPTTAGVGTGYYVKFTLTGTTYESGASDWTEITATREVRGVGSLLVEIASDSGGSTVVTSGTYTLDE